MEKALDEIKDLAERVAKELGYKIYNCSWSDSEEGPQLIIEVDKKGFISLNEISLFSAKLSPLLDEIAELDFPYTLICNSADAEREIKIEELDDYLDSYIEVVTKDDTHALGYFEVDDSGMILVKTFIKGKPKKWKIAKDDIKTINLRVKI